MILFTVLAATVLAPPVTTVRVEGEGYLRFVREGRTVYAREAVVTVDKGTLASKDGLPIVPRTQVPGDPESIRFEPDGRVFGVYHGADRLLGKTVVAVFADDVRPVEDRGWLVSSARATTGQAGSAGFGSIVTVNPTTSTKSMTAPTVTLRKGVEVRGDSFVLGDIAEIDAPPSDRERIANYEVASTPALGVEYKLTQEMVKGRFRRYGTATEAIVVVGEPSVTVTRKGQRVTHQMFLDQALAEASRRNVSATTNSKGIVGPDMVLPEGALTFAVSSFESSGSQISVRVDALVDGKKVNGRVVSLQSTKISANFSVGQTVKLLVRSNSAVVETTGKVKSVDKTTGLVTVVAATGAVMTGRALDNGTVEVAL